MSIENMPRALGYLTNTQAQREEEMHSNKESYGIDSVMAAAKKLKEIAEQWKLEQTSPLSKENHENEFKVTIELTDDNFSIPSKGSKEAVGYDLYSTKDYNIKPLEWKLIDTGVKLIMPQGLEAQIRSRSGLAAKGIFVLNSPGTIDPDYRGEIKVILANLSPLPFDIDRGDRIAQLVYNKYETPLLNATIISHKERGEEGFGSSDKNDLENITLEDI